MAEAAAAQQMGRGVLDNRIVKGPVVWDGEKKKWRHWSHKLKGYLSGVSKPLVNLMVLAETYRQEIDEFDMTDDQKALNGVLYSVLNGVTEGDAYDVLLNTEMGNGLEVWRKFAKENIGVTAGHTRNRLMHILEPKDLDGTYKAKLEKWEKRITDYSATGQPPPAEDVKMGVLQFHIAPADVRRHLSLNAARIATYQAMKDEIEAFISVEDGGSADAMDIGALEREPWKPGKGKD